MITLEATLRAQATTQLRDAALFLRWAREEDRVGHDEDADEDRCNAALAWLRREELLRAHRGLELLAACVRADDPYGYGTVRCRECYEEVERCERGGLCVGREARALLATMGGR